MKFDLAASLWPAARLGDALASLASTSGLYASNEKPETKNLDAESGARALGLEAIRSEASYSDFARQCRTIGPAILHVPSRDGYLALLRNSTVLTPALGKIRVNPFEVRSLLCEEMEASVAGQVQQVLDRAQVPASKRTRARHAILSERFNVARIPGVWLLRIPPGANFWQQLRESRVPRRLLALVAAHAIQYALWILAWWLVGSNLLSARHDPNWLWKWALLLVALVPFRVLITWLQGAVAIGAGEKLKQRLLFGALRLDPDSIRHQGAGQLLGRVLESEAVEALALSGGFLGLVALIELVIAIFVLSSGAGGALQATCLIGWLVMTGIVAWQYYRRNRAWTDVRLAMTHDLVESMVGHRTRLAQLPPDRWHEGEDEALERYLKASKVMDDSTAALIAAVPRGWLLIGLIGLAPAFIHGAASTARIAIAVGGMLLAYRALKRLSAGAWQLAGAAVAWERVSILFRSATRPEILGSPIAPVVGTTAVIEARDLVYRYTDRNEPVLRGCSMRIAAGDRVVLEGASGGGKTTLVSLLTGLRLPNSGRLLADGFDLHTLGSERWRKRIAAAPQFHENHVLAETFAFNLLMGRQGMPRPADMEEAETICQELGLGEVLARMPAGMLQMVGETGWQLSHGERSRLYIARALLQDAEVIVLDESFAALDPENLQRAVECVLKRARSLLVIAHR